MARFTIFANCEVSLEAKGYRFRSESDTEVLLFAFAAWGTECVRHIRGMFAFAIWRPAERALFLFRDPMGIKPLYYWIPPGGEIVFASELKAFLVFPGFRPTLDRRAIGQFLEFGYTFEDDRTILNGVHKLPPGHFMRVRANEKPELERYFRPEVASDRTAKSGDVEEELYATLEEVTAQHLIADVPVGLLLSGGLDFKPHRGACRPSDEGAHLHHGLCRFGSRRACPGSSRCPAHRLRA